MTPRVSVLLPVFDAARTLELCLRSVARQTEERFECVIVDDGSRDASLAIARSFAARDPRFRVLAEPHRGLVPALNRGIDACRAPVIARMDGDDVMHRRRLEEQLAAVEESGAAAVGCHVRLFPRSSLSDGLLQYERWLASIRSAEEVRREAFVECPIAHPTLMVRGAVLRELGYRDEGWPEDYDLVLRLLEAGHRITVVPRRLLLWRDGPRRLSRLDARYGLDRFTRCRAHFLARGSLRHGERYVLWGYGGTGKALAKALRAHGKEPATIVELHPGRIGQRIGAAEVIAPEGLHERRDLPILVSVAGAEARGQIREALRAMGFDELRHFVCCA